MNESKKIAIAFDDNALEILQNVYPELRNAAVNIAIKMLARDPIYKKYFCMNCEQTEDEIIEDLSTAETTTPAQQTNNTSQPAVQTWDDFI